MKYLEAIEGGVSQWPGVSMHPHRFGGKEFRFEHAEIGHLHLNGVLDIPFTRRIRDVLIEHGLGEVHRYVPDSGWTTFRIRSEADVKQGLKLLRLSYVRYLLKTAPDPIGLWAQESRALQLPVTIETLLPPQLASRKQ
jgi:hypothetical protein